MENEELEQILSKYHLPSTPPGLDERISRDIKRQLNAVRWRLYVGNLGMVIFDALGFGYLGWLWQQRSADDQLEVEMVII